MPTCLIDGKEVEFKPGENLIQVAARAGVEVPYFCYHPGLSVVAQCRICTVEIEGMPKLQTACSTPPKEGMKVLVNSDRAKQNRESVMEFLLINHPLDCPICDKSGECDLQDFSYEHGSQYQRYTEERRTYLDLDMGPVIQKNMNRCIHCTRCIRLGDEILGMREMVALNRGNNVEIATLDGRSLESDYAGNYADVCPTGSLTLKDFRFNKRAWMLKKTATTCEACSRGCNMEAHWDANVVHRCLPRENMEVNKYWLCDEGRFNFRYTQSEDRVVEPMKDQGQGEASWSEAVELARRALGGKKVAVLLGSDATLEEATLVKDFAAKNFSGAQVLHYGTPGISKVSDDGHEDQILRMKSKTSNLNGMEKLGITGFQTMPGGVEAVLVFRGGRASLPSLKGVKAVGVGVFMKDQLKHFDVVLPGLTFLEKDGTVVNFQGREQQFHRAIAPPRSCKPVSEVVMMWMNSKGATA